MNVAILFFLSLSLSGARAENLTNNTNDVLDDGALDNLETELKATCSVDQGGNLGVSQRAGEAKLFFSAQILDRTEKLNEVLKRKFMAIHNYFRNPYEPPPPEEKMKSRSQLQLAVEDLDRLENQGQSSDQIEAQRSKVKILKSQMDRQIASEQNENYVSPERMAAATAEMKKLGNWADRLDKVHTKAAGCYGVANNFRVFKDPSSSDITYPLSISGGQGTKISAPRSDSESGNSGGSGGSGDSASGAPD